VTGLVDNWPNKLRKHRRLFTGLVSIFIFAISLPMVTEVKDNHFLSSSKINPLLNWKLLGRSLPVPAYGLLFSIGNVDAVSRFLPNDFN